MALLQQPVNSDASMATGDDAMEFSTDTRSPMIQDDIEIDVEGGGASLPDHDMVEGETGDALNVDDEMAEGDAGAAHEQPPSAVTGDAGDDLDFADVEHSDNHVKDGNTNDVATNAASAHLDVNSTGVKADTATVGTSDSVPAADANDGAEIIGDEENAEEEGGQAEESEEDSPPPRRPAGKGPAGRAPQKTPAFSTAAADDVPDTTSQDSGEESHDEEIDANGANPTTTEPSFTESAKHESESEDDSDDGMTAAAPVKQPAYRESISDSDSESLVDHGPVHSIIVDYQGSKISLFPPQPDHEQQESYLLQDEGLCHEPIARMLGECRHVLRETLLEDEELLLTIPCLGISISEQLAETMSTTMTELVDLFLQLSYNDGVDAPAALRVTLDTKEKCHARIELIRRMINDGKGLSHVLAHLDGSAAATVVPPLPGKTVAQADFAAGQDELSGVDDQAESTKSVVDAFVPSEPQDFEEQFDVQTPGGDVEALEGATGEADPDFLDFTSPEKQGKAPVGKDTSNFTDVFDGDFGSADNLINVTAGDDSLDLQGGQAGLADFGAELSAANFVDTFDATNNGEGSAEMGQTGLQGGNIGDSGFDLAAPSGNVAQAAEDEFTFIDTADDGGNDAVIAVGDGNLDSDLGQGNFDGGSPAGTKRSRPEDDDTTLLESAPPITQTKRARAA